MFESSSTKIMDLSEKKERNVSEWPELILIKSVATGNVINSLRQVFANQDIPKVKLSSNVTQFSFSQFEDICPGLNISFLPSPPKLNDLDESPVNNVERQLLVSRVLDNERDH
ncbi:hypothetical protein ACTXT7_010491 [Hymenolepis weldensis]